MPVSEDIGFGLQVVGQVARSVSHAIIYGGAPADQPTMFFNLPNPKFVAAQNAITTTSNVLAVGAATSAAAATVPPMWNKDP